MPKWIRTARRRSTGMKEKEKRKQEQSKRALRSREQNLRKTHERRRIKSKIK